jgi:hypothetical protein
MRRRWVSMMRVVGASENQQPPNQHLHLDQRMGLLQQLSDHYPEEQLMQVTHPLVPPHRIQHQFRTGPAQEIEYERAERFIEKREIAWNGTMTKWIKRDKLSLLNARSFRTEKQVENSLTGMIMLSEWSK